MKKQCCFGKNSPENSEGNDSGKKAELNDYYYLLQASTACARVRAACVLSLSVIRHSENSRNTRPGPPS